MISPSQREPREEGDFTKREFQVLDLLSYGKPEKQVAAELGISYHTVRTHVNNMREKFGAHTNHQAVAFAFMDGIVH